MPSSPRGSTLLILLLWGGITALDLDKAFHIDDVFHLKAAQWIEHHPGTPMSGLVNWANDPEPMHRFNQPPGFFYLVALTGHVLGYSEAPMHAMRALFTLLALVWFHRLARHFAPGHAPLLTALFAFCPAFMVNQGLMTDVPMLALHLLFIRLLVVPVAGTSAAIRYVLAALVLSAALFIKYSSLPLLLVFPLALVLKREMKGLPAALIPVALLIGWSAWNVHEYGGIHILDREGGDASPLGIVFRTLGLLSAFGAIAPFTPLFLGGLLRRAERWLFPAWVAACVTALGFGAGVHSGLIDEPTSDRLLRVAFPLNGLLLVALCARYVPRSLNKTAADTWILVAWALGMALFNALFAPAMATRYALLSIPAVLLLAAPALDAVRRRDKALAVACTGALGLMLTLADRAYAGFYRDQAPRIAREMRSLTTGTVWSLGHWGWQWYSEQAGLAIYGSTTSAVKPGDILVIPLEHDAQGVAADLPLERIAEWDAPPAWSSFFNVDHFASMYTSNYIKLPWTLSPSRHRTIIAYRVGRSPVAAGPDHFPPLRRSQRSSTMHIHPAFLSHLRMSFSRG